MIIGAFVVTPLILSILIGTILNRPLTKAQALVACTLFGMFAIGGAFEVSFPLLKALFDPSDGLCLKPLFARITSRENLGNALRMAVYSRAVFTPADLLNTFVVRDKDAKFPGHYSTSKYFLSSPLLRSAVRARSIFRQVRPRFIPLVSSAAGFIWTVVLALTFAD